MKKSLVWSMAILTILLLIVAATALANGQTYFRFDNLRIDPLPVAKPGQPVTVSAVVKSIGGAEGSAYANLFVSGILADTQEVKLKPGEEATVSFPVTFSRTGIQEVSIANLTPIRVKVYTTPEPVLWLNFDDVTGTGASEGYIVTDASGLENNGIVRGEVRWVDGIKGKAVHTGETGFIEIPNTPVLDITGNSLTIMAWLYPNNEEKYSDFFTKGEVTVLQVKGSNTTLNFYSGGWGRGEATAPVPEGWNQAWHHICGVVDGQVLKLYVDGNLLVTKGVEGDIGHTDFPWLLGANGERPGRPTEGYIDDARIYLEPLTQEEIRQVIEDSKR